MACRNWGIAAGRTVEVNGYLQTSFPHIYAAGDVAGPYEFTQPRRTRPGTP